MVIADGQPGAAVVLFDDLEHGLKEAVLFDN